MTVRQLESSEWARIVDHPALHGWIPDPETSIVVIAEDEGGEIVGMWVAQNMVQLEGFWIHPSHQKAGRLPVRIVAKMGKILDDCRVQKAICWSDRPEISGYLSRLGMTPLPVDTFLFETSKCHSLLPRS